jgi:hypothetical protein
MGPFTRDGKMQNHRDAYKLDVSCHRHLVEDCQIYQMHSLESVNEAKAVFRRGVSIGQATSYRACWKLVAQLVRALEDAIFGSMCQ